MDWAIAALIAIVITTGVLAGSFMVAIASALLAPILIFVCVTVVVWVLIRAYREDIADAKKTAEAADADDREGPASKR